MKINQTTDKFSKSATFGIENNVPWVEYTAGKRDRVSLYGHTKSMRNRMRNEVISRGIAIPSHSGEFLTLLEN